MPGGRDAVEFDTGTFVDTDGNPVIGFESGNTSSYNFTVPDDPWLASAVDTGSGDDDWLMDGVGNDTFRGKRGDDALFGNDGDDRIKSGFGEDVFDRSPVAGL